MCMQSGLITAPWLTELCTIRASSEAARTCCSCRQPSSSWPIHTAPLQPNTAFKPAGVRRKGPPTSHNSSTSGASPRKQQSRSRVCPPALGQWRTCLRAGRTRAAGTCTNWPGGNLLATASRTCSCTWPSARTACTSAWSGTGVMRDQMEQWLGGMPLRRQI